jgi:tetratricopeptide (TPR) repeat protein
MSTSKLIQVANGARQRLCLVAVAAAPFSAALLQAQDTAQAMQGARAHIEAGDSDRAAIRLAEALAHYEQAIAADSTAYEALWKASHVAVSLGEFNPDRIARDSLFLRGERYGRMAVAANPDDAEGHFVLARALGRNAMTKGIRERARYGVEVRNEAMAALAINPQHAGALHVMGAWHLNVMRLNKVQRLAARTFLGAKEFREASWAEAERYLEAAVAASPNAIIHRLGLGLLYADRKQNDKASEQFRWIIAAPSIDVHDDEYRREAEAALKALK